MYESIYSDPKDVILNKLFETVAVQLRSESSVGLKEKLLGCNMSSSSLKVLSKNGFNLSEENIRTAYTNFPDHTDSADAATIVTASAISQRSIEIRCEI